MQRTGLPVLGLLHQVCPKSIAPDIATDGQKMRIILDREALERTLVEMPRPGGVVVGMVSSRVGCGDPAEQPSHGAVVAGPQNQVPVVGHEAEGEQIDWVASQSLRKRPQEGPVVFGFVKDFVACVATIESMIEAVPLIGSL